MSTLIIEPLSYGFMQRALLATLAVAVAAPMAGVWAVQRRLVYLADALSHAVLAGVAAAALLGASLLAGAFLTALLMGGLVSLLVVRARVAEDAAIGTVGQGLFALGVLGLSFQTEPRALGHILFGNALTVSRSDVIADVVLAALVVATVLWLLPVLCATTFDPVHARAVGLPVAALDAVVVLGLAVAVVIGLTSVGALMALTLSVAPAVAARLLTHRIGAVLAIAVAGGTLAGVVGLFIAYHAALPTGPVVALIAVSEVALAALVVTARHNRPPWHPAARAGYPATGR